MALIDCKFFSETLGMCSSLRAIPPQKVAQKPSERHPALGLVDGASDDERT